MDKLKRYFNNPANFWGIISLTVILIVFFIGRRLGIDEAQEKLGQKDLPDGGDSLGGWGGNGNKTQKQKNAEAYAIQLAENLYKAISGIQVTKPDGTDSRIVIISTLSVLGNDQLVSVYNKYNSAYAKKWWGFETMTEAIEDEFIFTDTNDVKGKLVTRLKSLKCK